MPEPVLPPLPDFRYYSSSAAAASPSPARSGKGKPGSARTWEYVLVPKAPGPQTIPALRYPFFDPARRAYRVAETKPLSLQVSRGAAEPAVASGVPAAETARRGVEPVRRDIAYLKLEAPRLGDDHTPFQDRRGVLLMLTAPLVLNLGALVFQWQRRRGPGDAAAARRRNARRVAARKLGEWKRSIDRGGAAVSGLPAGVAEALEGYLADRFGESAQGLTRDRIGELVGSSGAATARELLTLLGRCDELRFAPAGAGPGELKRIVEHASRLLASLDRVIRREKAA